jgi:hypothetical protein
VAFHGCQEHGLDAFGVNRHDVILR